jgi:hypothetical protein
VEPLRDLPTLGALPLQHRRKTAASLRRLSRGQIGEEGATARLLVPLERLDAAASAAAVDGAWAHRNIAVSRDPNARPNICVPALNHGRDRGDPSKRPARAILARGLRIGRTLAAGTYDPTAGKRGSLELG